MHKGFKSISIENLLDRDEHPAYRSNLQGDEWVKRCLSPRLSQNVPEEIVFLFEAARGAMIYGMFFLPLVALATEQCFRVLEAGARRCHKQLGLWKPKDPDEHVPFKDVVQDLERAGKICPSDSGVWNSLRDLRNKFSHAESATIRERHNAVEQMEFVAELLNRLFAS